MNLLKLILSLIILSFIFSCGEKQNDAIKGKQNKEYHNLEMQKQNKEKEVNKYKSEIEKLKAKKDSLNAKLDSISN